MKQETAELLITGRLLILQSKRLMIRGLELQLHDRSPDALRERIVQMRSEATHAQHAYRTAVLGMGTPETPEFWLIAYGRLIDVGNATVRKLRESAAGLPLDERYQVSADVEALEAIIATWTESMRTAMSPAVA